MREIKVIILEHKEEGKPCPASCSVDWLSEDSQRVARERLRERFGEGVSLEIYNLEDEEAREKFSHYLERVHREGLLLPLLIINGEIRISGHFDFRMLLDMVEASIEGI